MSCVLSLQCLAGRSHAVTKVALSSISWSGRTYSSGGPDEYLHHSVVPTDHFQKSLPRLPVPKLDDTCRRYLNALKPILKDDQFQKTEKIVESFKNGDGKVLQEALIEKDKKNKHTNYVSGLWFDMYLKDRRSLVLTHNPFMAFNADPRPAYNEQLVRATNIVISSARFKKTLEENILEPEIFHLNPEKSDNKRFRTFVKYLPKSVSWYGAYWYMAFPLDMSQFKSLFNSTRIPRPNKDELFNDLNAKHLVVLRNGNLYVFDVLDRDGNICPAAEILSHLTYIKHDKTPAAEYPLGILTSETRDVWTSVREKLVQAGNADALKLVDSAMFALVLEDADSEDPNAISRLFLYGDGANRWFDKSFTLIMTPTGKTAVNFEHSWGDGVAVLRYFNEVFKDSTTRSTVHPDTRPAAVNSAAAVKKLDFKLTDEIKNSIKEATGKFKAATSRLDVNFLRCFQYNKNYIKNQKLSPDSFMQLAFQMAFYKQYGETVATYESCSTSAFKHGRTETVRSCTTATKRACQLFHQRNPQPSVSELRASLDECSKIHFELTKEAAMGQGFDRHLLGLKQIATDRGGALPEVYTDPAYTTINHNILSTSTLSSPAVQLGGFAPVVQDGYGVGYNAEEGYLGCNVTSYPPARDVNKFLQCVEQSLVDMHDVLAGNQPKN